MVPHRAALLLALLLTAACKNETAPSSDAGSSAPAIADAAADAPAADAAVDAPTPDADAPAGERPEGDHPAAACADPPGGYCLQGFLEWGCCGDVGIQMICVSGRWQCPPGSVESTKCCGSGAACLRDSLDPRCDRMYTDASNRPIVDR